MTTRLNPYLTFKDNAKEAMEFYQGVFGGTLVMNTFGEFGDPDMPGADLIMHGMLETDKGFTLMGADTPPGQDFASGSAITVSLSGDDDPDSLRAYWTALAEGGNVVMPLETQMWGDDFGMCVDRFGIPWMVNIAGTQG